MVNSEAQHTFPTPPTHSPNTQHSNQHHTLPTPPPGAVHVRGSHASILAAIPVPTAYCSRTTPYAGVTLEAPCHQAHQTLCTTNPLFSLTYLKPFAQETLCTRNPSDHSTPCIGPSSQPRAATFLVCDTREHPLPSTPQRCTTPYPQSRIRDPEPMHPVSHLPILRVLTTLIRLRLLLGSTGR
jgi:hypothetical protein